MAAYMIGLQLAAFGTESDWIRADRYDDGVGIDRSGLCKLDREECLQLARWLTETASAIPERPDPAILKLKRKRGRKSASNAPAHGDAA